MSEKDFTFKINAQKVKADTLHLERHDHMKRDIFESHVGF